MGRVALAQGRLADARAAYEASLERVQAWVIPRAIAGTSLGLARVARHEASADEASGLLAEAVRIYRVTADDGGLAHTLVEGALQQATAGQHRDAVGLLAAAKSLRGPLGIVTPGSEAPEIAAARAAATDALGASEVHRLVELARQATLDDVIGWLPFRVRN